MKAFSDLQVWLGPAVDEMDAFQLEQVLNFSIELNADDSMEAPERQDALVEYVQEVLGES